MNKIIFAFLALTLSLNVIAAEKDQNIYIGYGFGSTNNIDLLTGNNASIIDPTVGAWTLKYNYRLNENWFANIGYTNTNSQRANIFLENLISDAEVNSDEFLAGFKGVRKLGSFWSVYLEGGLSYFDYDIKDKDLNTILHKDNGVGFHFGSGFIWNITDQFNFNMGFGYHNLSDVRYKTADLGITIEF